MEKEIAILITKMEEIQMFQIVPNRKAQDYFLNADIIYSNPNTNTSLPNSNNTVELTDLDTNLDNNSNDNMEEVLVENDSTVPLEFQEELQHENLRKEQEDESVRIEAGKKKVKVVTSFSKFINLYEEGKKKKLRYYVLKIINLFNSNAKLIFKNVLILFDHKIDIIMLDRILFWLQSSQHTEPTFSRLCQELHIHIPQSILYIIII